MREFIKVKAVDDNLDARIEVEFSHWDEKEAKIFAEMLLFAENPYGFISVNRWVEDDTSCNIVEELAFYYYDKGNQRYFEL